MERSDTESAANYQASRYRTPDGAPADIVIFTIAATAPQGRTKALPELELQVLLIERKRWPFEGRWALPGGFSHETETIRAAAERELAEETGVAGVHIDYLGVYSEPGRDPRGWMISHAYFALVREEELRHRRAADDAADVRLFPVEEALAMELAFDHGVILRDALERVRSQMLATDIAKEFLPGEFTIGELYQVIRAVVPAFEERNFTRKITSTQSREGIIEKVLAPDGTPKLSNRYSQRGAQLYRFTGFVPAHSIYN